MKSVIIPRQYDLANDFLRTNSTGKTIVFPPSAYTHPIFNWSNGSSFPAAWPSDAFSVPLLFGSGSQATIFCYYTYFDQLDNLIKNDTSYFAPFGVSNIVIHNDQLPTGYFYDSCSSQLTALMTNQRNLKLQYNNSIFNIFDTSYHSDNITLSNPVAVFGGLMTYVLMVDSGLNTSEFSPIYLSELNSAGISYTLNNSNIVILGPHQNLTDAFLDYETNKQIPLVQFSNSAKQMGWVKISDFNTLMQQLMTRYNYYVVNDGYFFGNGESLCSSAKDSSIFIPLNFLGNYTIYINALKSPFSGNVTISSGHYSQIIDLYSPHSITQTWIPLHFCNDKIEGLYLTNDNGTNLINSILPLGAVNFSVSFSSFIHFLSDKTILKLNFQMFSNVGNVQNSNPMSLKGYNLYARALNGEFAQLFNVSSKNATSLQMQFGVYNFTNGVGNAKILITNVSNGSILLNSHYSPICVSSKNLTSSASTISIPLSQYNLTPHKQYAIILRPTDYSVNLLEHYIYFEIAFPKNQTDLNSSEGSLLYFNGSIWENTGISSYFLIYSPGPVINPLCAQIIKVKYYVLSSNENSITNGINISSENLNNLFSLNYSINGDMIQTYSSSSHLMLIYDQTYNTAWRLNNVQSVPTYFMLNGFFLSLNSNQIKVQINYSLSLNYYLENYFMLISLIIFLIPTAVIFLKKVSNVIRKYIS